MKTTGLTQAAVYPGMLQLQNVSHVMNVFNDRVIGALKLKGYFETANFISKVLQWWHAVNVCRKGEDIRFRNLDRCVQTPSSSNLPVFAIV